MDVVTADPGILRVLEITAVDTVLAVHPSRRRRLVVRDPDRLREVSWSSKIRSSIVISKIRRMSGFADDELQIAPGGHEALLRAEDHPERHRVEERHVRQVERDLPRRVAVDELRERFTELGGRMEVDVAGDVSRPPCRARCRRPRYGSRRRALRRPRARPSASYYPVLGAAKPVRPRRSRPTRCPLPGTAKRGIDAYSARVSLFELEHLDGVPADIAYVGVSGELDLTNANDLRGQLAAVPDTQSSSSISTASSSSTARRCTACSTSLVGGVAGASPS